MRQVTGGTKFPDLTRLGQKLSFTAGDVLYDDPHPRSWTDRANVVLIGAGRVAETLHNEDGQELMLGITGRGGVIGLGKLLEASGWSRNAATALTDGHGFTIPYGAFTGFLDDHRLWGYLAREMAERLARSHERLMEMTYANCDQRLARILIELLGLDGERGWDTITEKPRCTTVPLTQAQLAALLCARRETVERSLRDWRARNIVTTGPRAVAVQDLEQLARLAGTTLARLRSAYEPEPDGGCSRDGWRNAN